MTMIDRQEIKVAASYHLARTTQMTHSWTQHKMSGHWQEVRR